MSKYSTTETIRGIEFTFWCTGGVRCMDTNLFPLLNDEFAKEICDRLFQLYPKRILPKERIALPGMLVFWLDYNKRRFEYGPNIAEAIYCNKVRPSNLSRISN